MNEGSLYPGLYQLEDQAWIRAEWGVSSEGRRAKFYTLTAPGLKQLVTERQQWRDFSTAVDIVLEG